MALGATNGTTWDLTVAVLLVLAAVLSVRMICAFKLRAQANSRLAGWRFWIDEIFHSEKYSGLAETHEQFFPQSLVRSVYRVSGKVALGISVIYVLLYLVSN